ncbi:putative oxidoreductase C663.09c isoform X2 [Primulina tabacum]|uniref:putative oxidoreductase C663.09c isoform X2 n=1 Tax=Primulina tabacum TaxID=48773 RepID=UPI003F5A8FE9
MKIRLCNCIEVTVNIVLVSFESSNHKIRYSKLSGDRRGYFCWESHLSRGVEGSTVMNTSQRIFATPILLSFARTRIFSSASVKFREGGVSMVQGASRGIGLEFVKQLLEKSNKGNVVATCRNPIEATGLLELKNKFAERLDIHRLDLTVDSTMEEVAKSVEDKHGYLNLLVNASGILSMPDILRPETTLSKVKREALLLAYEVNAIGPLLVTKQMWPLLKAGGGTGTDRDFAIVANISARVGSIGDNRLGGWHSYRSSKAALNQLTKTVSVEFARKKDPIKLLSIIDDAKLSDNGKFFAWDGQEIPW